MSKYGNRLLEDLPQQFKGKEHIEALLEVIGKQMDEVKEFYDSLNFERSLDVAQGVHLDKIGEILAMTRAQAKELFHKDQSIDDELYRQLLKYKTIMNFGSATYYDIMSCLKSIQGYTGFKYREELSRPATIIFETEEPADSPTITQTLKTPVPKAAGVGLIIRANNGSTFGFGVGLTSQILLSREIELEEFDIDEQNDYLVDENLEMLTNEVGEIIVSEELSGPGY